MEQSALLDAIFNLYTTRNYNYWSMKALKHELKQPEAWLRENMEQVAVLHKTGRFANFWELKPEYKPAKNVAGGDAGGDQIADFGDEPGAEASGEDDDDDDNVEMVDVA